MTTTRQAEITADPDVPMIRTVREFDATPDKVFRAHTDPEILSRWVGPRGTETRIDHWDCRPGGSFRYVSSIEGDEYAFRGCFHAVRAPDLIIQTFEYEGAPDGIALERFVLEDLGDGRTRLVSTSLCETFEDRDQWLASGMEVGVNEGYAALDEILADAS